MRSSFSGRRQCVKSGQAELRGLLLGAQRPASALLGLHWRQACVHRIGSPHQCSAEISNFIAHRGKHTAHPPCGENARCHGFARTRFGISDERIAELNELLLLAVCRRERRPTFYVGENVKEPWFPELN